MSSFTYDQLFAALETWPEDDADEYQADLPRIISLGETKLIVDLNIEIFDQVDSSIVVTGNNRLVPKPDGCISTRTLWLITANVRTRLDQRSRDWCDNFAPDPTVLTVPRYYCEYSEDFWYIVGTPNQSGTAQANMIIRPPGLSDSNQDTWLGTNAGDLLFAACLMEAEQWLKADDRYADIKGTYDEKLGVRRLELVNLIRTGQYSPPRAAAKPA